MQRKFFVGLASVFGLGFMPKAPGTFGSLAAIPLWALSFYWNISWQWAAFAGIFLISFSIWISSQAEKYLGEHDSGHIVIDEVCGMFVTSIALPFQWPWILVAFILFRILDACKPWPINLLDEKLPGGFGVVMDDVAAGVIGCGALHAVRYFLPHL